MISTSRIILQPDWNIISRSNPTEKIWAIFENSAGKRSHLQIELKDYLAYKEGNNIYSDDFSAHINQEKPGTLSVKCNWKDDNSSCDLFIVSPTRQFGSIHSSCKYVRCLDVTSGGLGISCASEDQIFIWNTSSGEVRRQLKGHFGDIYTCRFFPSGIVALTAGADFTVRVWAADTGLCAATMKGHAGGVNDTAVIDRGRNILSCSRDGSVRLWDVSNQTSLHIFDVAPTGLSGNYCINNICLSNTPNSPDEKLVLAACESGRFVGFSLQEKKNKVFDLKLSAAVNCCTTVDNKAVCGTQGGQIIVIDLRNPTSSVEQFNMKSRGAILSVGSLGHHIWATSSDGSAFTCENCVIPGQENPVVELSGPDCEPVTCIASDGRHCYTSCRDGIIRKYLLSEQLSDENDQN